MNIPPKKKRGAPFGNQRAKGGKGNTTPRSTYKPEYAKVAKEMTRLGAVEIEIADYLEVDVVTFNRWKHCNPDLVQALKLGKDTADQRVVKSLFTRATGYSYDSVKIFCQDGQVTKVPFREHVPPCVTACIFWLKNRRPDLWRDKHHLEATGKDGTPLNAAPLKDGPDLSVKDLRGVVSAIQESLAKDGEKAGRN